MAEPEEPNQERTSGFNRRCLLGAEAEFWSVVQNFRQVGGAAAEIEEEVTNISVL